MFILFDVFWCVSDRYGDPVSTPFVLFTTKITLLILVYVFWYVLGCQRRSPGLTRATWSQRGILEAKCVQTPMFYQQKLRERPFRVDETSVAVTVYRAYA